MVRRALLQVLVGIELLISCSFAVTACTPTTQPGDTASEPTTADILWDEWGIPHIFAGSDEAMFYSSGWAQARAHGDLLLRLYGTSRGRAAEYWGAEHLDSDRWVHTMGVPGRAETWLGTQSDEARGMLEAFVAGINTYAAAHPNAIDDSVEVVLPVTPADVLAQVQRSIHFTFMAHPLRAAYVGEQWEPGRSSDQAGVDLRMDAAPDIMAGSNAWALSPSRSASGNALLLANPHLPWSDLFTWFEAQWSSPDFDSYGATLVGFPTPSIAFNDFLGWTHTVNTLDATDVYELKLAEGGIDAGYVFDGEVRPFEMSTVTIKVKNGDGSYSEEELTVRSSVHGPVFAHDATGALALRVAGLDQPGLLDQYLAMNRATNLAEFEEASSRLQMPMFTTMYADRDGHVMHLFGGRVPVRPQEKEFAWDAIVPGDTSETLWAETYSYEQLPKVIDPESGWLQNANDPPWTTTFPRALDPSAFPKHMAPRFMHFRAQQSAQLLSEDDSMTFEEFEDAKHSTEMEWAVRIVDDLESAVAEHGDAKAREAMAVLAAWDRRATPTAAERFSSPRSRTGCARRATTGLRLPGIPTNPPRHPMAWLVRPSPRSCFRRWRAKSRPRTAASRWPGAMSIVSRWATTICRRRARPVAWASSACSASRPATTVASVPSRVIRMSRSSSSPTRPGPARCSPTVIRVSPARLTGAISWSCWRVRS